MNQKLRGTSTSQPLSQLDFKLNNINNLILKAFEYKEVWRRNPHNRSSLKPHHLILVLFQ